MSRSPILQRSAESGTAQCHREASNSLSSSSSNSEKMLSGSGEKSGITAGADKALPEVVDPFTAAQHIVATVTDQQVVVLAADETAAEHHVALARISRRPISPDEHVIKGVTVYIARTRNRTSGAILRVDAVQPEARRAVQ